jgi:hypothetical protein
MEQGLTTNEIERHVKELQHAIVIAKLNYEIWWLYKGKQNRKRFVDVLNDYPLFFQTSLHAHFVAMIIALYRLCETRKDTINLLQLVRLLRKDSTLPVQEIKSMESDIARMKPLWQKVSILRNDMFGHQSNKFDDDTVWKKASVTSNQFKKLIHDSEDVLNRITHVWAKSTHVFNLSATSDAERLLADLKWLNEKKLKQPYV